MADVKWIKTDISLFDNRKIKQIEVMPEGDAIIVIWFKLLCLAGTINDKGLVYFTSEIPFTEEMLATEFKKPIMVIKLALKTFEEFGMIEIINDIICVSNWEKYQNIDGLERVREQTRKRVAKCRENQRLLAAKEDVTLHVALRNAIDKEEDKDKEINMSEKSDESVQNNSLQDELKKNFEIIYASYPVKKGKTKGFEHYKAWVTNGRVISGTKHKLTNKQIWTAIAKYKKEMEEQGTELQYYKHFDTFMCKAILDYVDEEK